CAAMASACSFGGALAAAGALAKTFFGSGVFSQKFLLLGRVQLGLGLGALRFRLGDTLLGVGGGPGGGTIGSGEGVGLNGMSAMRFALSRKAGTFQMAYVKESHDSHSLKAAVDDVPTQMKAAAAADPSNQPPFSPGVATNSSR